MDSLITAAARALALGDPLAALQRVALREDPPALALRGIAMAQLGEHVRARELLRRAAKGFGAHEALSRARCVVAEAEVALALRELGGSLHALQSAAATLARHGDVRNAAQARLVLARRHLLVGHLPQAAEQLAGLQAPQLPPALAAVHALCEAELAWRSWRSAPAAEALAIAAQAAQRAGVPALQAEVAHARAQLARPAARRRSAQGEQALTLREVEAVLASPALVVDACRRVLSAGAQRQDLSRRPILFSLLLSLAQAWPLDAERGALIQQAFRLRRPDETHRARLRVEIGRLRALTAGVAEIQATARGFALRPREGRELVVLAPPIDAASAGVLALLSDGAAWSSSALALALGATQRGVQRELAALLAQQRVRAVGEGRARRWLAPPLAEFATILLLPAALPLH